MKAYSRGLSAVTQYKFVMYLPPTHGRDWCTTWFCRVLWCPSKNTKSPSVSTHFNGVAFYLPCRSYFSVAVILRASVLHEKEKDRCLHTSTENGKRKTKIGLMLQNNFCAFLFFFLWSPSSPKRFIWVCNFWGNFLLKVVQFVICNAGLDTNVFTGSISTANLGAIGTSKELVTSLRGEVKHNHFCWSIIVLRLALTQAIVHFPNTLLAQKVSLQQTVADKTGKLFVSNFKRRP